MEKYPAANHRPAVCGGAATGRLPTRALSRRCLYARFLKRLEVALPGWWNRPGESLVQDLFPWLEELLHLRGPGMGTDFCRPLAGFPAAAAVEVAAFEYKRAGLFPAIAF
jgi:hypothetical protein